MSDPDAKEQGVRIGSFAGAPIVIDPTILLLAAYVLGSAVMRDGVGALEGALLFLAALIVAVLLHEFGHAGVAAMLKLRSKRIVLTFFGGHVEFAEQPKSRWHDALVSFAGPAVNLLTFFILQQAGPTLAGAPDRLIWFLDNFAYVSLLLGAFNLLPGFPLDGGRILRALLSFAMSVPRARFVAGVCGLIVALGLIGFAAWAQLPWTIFIGLFLALAAWVEIKNARAALAANDQPPTMSNA